MILLTSEVVDQFQHLIPDHRVQAGSGFVQNQQLGVMAQGGGQAQFHLHSFGKIGKGLFLRQLEPVQQRMIPAGIPAGVGVMQHPVQLGGGDAVGKSHFVQHHSQILLQGRAALGRVLSQHLHTAAVPANQV